MTLVVAVTSELAPEAERLVGRLRRHGVRVEARAVRPSGNVRGDNEALWSLRAGSADAALVRARALLDLPAELHVTAVLPREGPRDVLVPCAGDPLTLETLPSGARVGVGDGRRRSFLRAYRRDVQAVLPTEGVGGSAPGAARPDAVILGIAEAGRRCMRQRATEIFDPKAWVPGVGQGTVVIVSRAGDARAAEGYALLDDPSSRAALVAESAVVAACGGGADTPIGVIALPTGRWIRVWAMGASEDGERVVRGDVTGAADRPEAAGRALAELLLARGAAAILQRGGPA